MVEFKCHRFRKDVPFIKDADIDLFAEAVIADYNPKMLTDVISIDYMHFLEVYLRLDFQFADIYFGSNEEPIEGATAFNEGDKLKIFDKAQMRTDKIVLGRGSVVLDNTLTASNMARRQLFTGLHEGGHWMLHQRYYSRNGFQLSFLEPTASMMCCRKSGIEGKRELKTNEDFLEHQANMFASAIAMPKAIILKVMSSELKKYQTKTDSAFMLSKMFDVSEIAAKIRLEKLGFFKGSEAVNLLIA